jgi:hypothetical protein
MTTRNCLCILPFYPFSNLFRERAPFDYLLRERAPFDYLILVVVAKFGVRWEVVTAAHRVAGVLY